MAPLAREVAWIRADRRKRAERARTGRAISRKPAEFGIGWRSGARDGRGPRAERHRGVRPSGNRSAARTPRSFWIGPRPDGKPLHTFPERGPGRMRADNVSSGARLSRLFSRRQQCRHDPPFGAAYAPRAPTFLGSVEVERECSVSAKAELGAEAFRARVHRDGSLRRGAARKAGTGSMASGRLTPPAMGRLNGTHGACAPRFDKLSATVWVSCAGA